MKISKKGVTKRSFEISSNEIFGRISQISHFPLNMKKLFLKFKKGICNDFLYLKRFSRKKFDWANLIPDRSPVAILARCVKPVIPTTSRRPSELFWHFHLSFSELELETFQTSAPAPQDSIFVKIRPFGWN